MRATAQGGHATPCCFSMMRLLLLLATTTNSARRHWYVYVMLEYSFSAVRILNVLQLLQDLRYLRHLGEPLEPLTGHVAKSMPYNASRWPAFLLIAELLVFVYGLRRSLVPVFVSLAS
jgi:hypothetical protein